MRSLGASYERAVNPRDAPKTVMMYFICAANFLRMVEVSGIIPGSELRSAQVFGLVPEPKFGDSTSQQTLAFSGLVIGAYAIGRVLSLPIYIWQTRREAVIRRPYLIMTVFSFTGNLLYLRATSPWHLVAARAVKGMAASIDYPNKMAMSGLFEGSERSQAFMLAESATMAGLAMGPLVASILACIPLMEASSLICVFSICANLLLLLCILSLFPVSIPIATASSEAPLNYSSEPISRYLGASDDTARLRSRASGVLAVIAIGFLRNLTRLGFEAGFCSVMMAQFGFGFIPAGFLLTAVVATGAPVNIICRVVGPRAARHDAQGKRTSLDDIQLLHATEPMAFLACFWLVDAQWPGSFRILAFLIGSFLLYPLNTVSAGICSSLVTKLAVNQKQWANGHRDPGWWFARERLVLYDTMMAVSAGQLCGPWLVRSVLAHHGVTQDTLALVCMCAVGAQMLIVWFCFGMKRFTD